jgi:hypothetical protein
MAESQRAECVINLQLKYTSRMQARKEQCEKIKANLYNFKNEKFKAKVAELLQWCMLQVDPPKLLYDHYFSNELKLNLKNLKCYDGNLTLIAEDVNQRFKYMSPTKTTPFS